MVFCFLDDVNVFIFFKERVCKVYCFANVAAVVPAGMWFADSILVEQL